MSKKIFTFFITFLIIFSYSFTQTKQVRVIAEKANVYLDASEHSYLIGTLAKGTILNIYGSDKIRGIGKDWYYVSYKSKRMGSVVTGFIDASKVELLEPQKSIDAEQEEALEEAAGTELMEERKTEEKKSETAKADKVEAVKEKAIATVPKEKEPKEKPQKIFPKKPPTPKVSKEITVRPRFGIGVIASYAMPSEGDYGSGLAFGMNFHIGITRNFAVELGGLKYQTNTDRSLTGLSEGKLSVTPIQLSIQARFPVSNKIVPYIRGGAGYSMNNFKINSGVAAQWSNLGYDIKETVENSVEFHFGAGIDVLLHKNIALNGDIRYLVSKTKGTWTFSNQIINTENSGNLDEVNLNTFTIGIGLKYLF